MPPIRGREPAGWVLHDLIRKFPDLPNVTNPVRGPVRMAAVMRTWGAAAGLLAGAVALGVAELAAAVTGPLGAPVVAVSGAAINLTPVPVKEFAIERFGTHDKQALIAGILVLLAGFAAMAGVLAVRRLGFGLAGLAAFAAIG